MVPRQRVAIPLLSRRFAEFATALVLLFVLQAGLSPFDFSTALASNQPRVYFGARIHDLILPDILSNIALYLPVGLCCAWTLPRFIKHRITTVCATMGITAALSGTVEFAQAFLPSRVSSAIDLTANVVGAALGICVVLVSRWTVPRLVAAASDELRHAPRIAVTKAYVVTLFVFAAAPFSFTFDTTRLYRSVRSARIVPFASLGASTGGVADVVASGAHSRASGSQPGVPTDPRALAVFHKWQRDRHWARWGAEAASFLLLGLLVGVVLRYDYGFTLRSSAALTAWLCGALAVLLSAVHLFIVSRSFDTTDILFRVLGAGLAIGLLANAVIRETDLRTVYARHRRLVTRLSCAAALTFIVYTGLIPLRFDWTGERLMHSVSTAGFLPFMSYNVARVDVMLADLMEKLVSWALLAGLAVASLRRPTSRANQPPAATVRIAAWCIGLSLLIETTQLFSPVRTASLTDPIIAGVAAAAGVALYTRFTNFYRYATTHEIRGRRAEPAHPIQRVLSPTDELIATLTEERDDAPVETAPTPRGVPGR